MSWTKEHWQSEIRAQLASVRQTLAEAGPTTVYGLLATTTMLPVLQAAASGEGTLAALLTVAGSLGSNLLASALDRWREHANDPQVVPEIAEALVTSAAQDAALRAELDRLFANLALVQTVRPALTDEDRRWFMEALAQEVRAIQRGTPTVVLKGDVQVGGVAIRNLYFSTVTIKGDVVGTKIINNPPPPTPRRWLPQAPASAT